MKDKYSTWWDEKSNFALALYRQRPVFYWHLLRAKQEEWVRAGTLLDESFQFTARGLYAEAELDHNEAGDSLLRLVESGVAAWSTGALPHLIRVRKDDGYVEAWPIIEASGLHVDSAGSLPGTTTVSHVRSAMPGGVYGDDELPLRRSIWVMSEVPSTTTQNGGAQPAATPAVQPNTPAAPTQAALPTQSEWQQLVQGFQAMRVQVDALANPATRQTSGIPLPQQHTHIQVASPYDDVTLFGLLFWDQAQRVLAARKYQTVQRSDKFMRAVVDKMAKIRKTQEDEPERFPGYVPLRCLDAEALALWESRTNYLRADEVMQSTLAGQGDEMVPTLMSSVAWYVFRLASRVLGTLDVFEMPGNPFTQVVISGGPTTRRIPEASDQSQASVPTSVYPASVPTTTLKTWNAGKIGSLALVSDELWQDAGLSVADVLANQFARLAAADIDYVLINGDETATTANISHDSVDPTGTTYDKILILNGLRKFAFDNSDTFDGATLAIGDLNTGRKLMGTRGNIGTDQQNLVCLIDPGVYYKLIEITEFRTYDKAGPGMTLLNGQVSMWDGVPVVVSDELENCDSAGKIPSSHAGTLGNLLVYHRQINRVGRRRDIEIEQGPIPFTGQFGMKWDIRVDLQAMETGSVAYGYNITV